MKKMDSRAGGGVAGPITKGQTWRVVGGWPYDEGPTSINPGGGPMKKDRVSHAAGRGVRTPWKWARVVGRSTVGGRGVVGPTS